MTKRRYIKQAEFPAERLAAFARLMRERAATMPVGPQREAALAKAEQADKAVRMDRWINSAELRSPN